MMRNIKFIFIGLLLLSCTGSVVAQKADSLAPIREFIQVSNSYKQLPLYLELELKNTTNFITSEQDTINAEGKFYLQPAASYIQFGEMEQFVNDTLAVLVSNRLQRIIVNNNPRPVLEQMKQLSGALLQDSSIIALGKKYKSELLQTKEGTVINLQNRTMLYSTSLPIEFTEMVYNSTSKQPVRTTTTKRILVPLSEEDYKQLNNDEAVKKNLLTIEDKGYFLIKEQSTTLIYKTVGHEPGRKIPVAVSDRVVKNSAGEYEPVTAYKDYLITIN